IAAWLQLGTGRTLLGNLCCVLHSAHNQASARDDVWLAGTRITPFTLFTPFTAVTGVVHSVHIHLPSLWAALLSLDRSLGDNQRQNATRIMQTGCILSMPNGT